MTQEEIITNLKTIFLERFEIENPGLDEDLREAYEFDSIDAIELLQEIEVLIDRPLERSEKKMAMEIRTFGQIVDYIDDRFSAEPLPDPETA